MRRKITTALLLQIELTNRHQVRSGTVLLPNFPRLEASRVVQAPVCSARCGFSTVHCSARRCVQHSPVCSELFSTMQLRRSDRQLRRPSPLHCCLTPGRRIFSFQLNRNKILRILASLTETNCRIGLFSLQTIVLDLFLHIVVPGHLFVASCQI